MSFILQPCLPKQTSHNSRISRGQFAPWPSKYLAMSDEYYNAIFSTETTLAVCLTPNARFIMGYLGTPVRLFRKIVFFALLGFGLIFLSGPVIALFSFILSAALVFFFVLLPFMLLGLIVWLPLRALFGSRGHARRDLVETGKLVGKAAFVMPMRTCGHVYARARCARARMRERAHTVTSFLGSILLEMISGALVGALLGAIIGLQMDALQFSIPIGAFIGSSLGLLVGASRARQPREALSSQLPEGLG